MPEAFVGPLPRVAEVSTLGEAPAGRLVDDPGRRVGGQGVAVGLGAGALILSGLATVVAA